MCGLERGEVLPNFRGGRMVNPKAPVEDRQCTAVKRLRLGRAVCGKQTREVLEDSRDFGVIRPIARFDDR
jgi:hypothetical protein